jgi:excinuclease ABC subunit C
VGAKWHTRRLHKLGSDPNLCTRAACAIRPHPTRTSYPAGVATEAPPSDLRDQARALPDAPGVYVWRTADGGVLYVGKAASLKKRVASYFASVSRDRKSEELVGRAASIEPIVVASASEALLLEQQLIKRHRPPLNARLRDDKSYPYIAVTLADEYPRVLFTRERHRAGVRYFGPYASAQKVRTTLETLNKIFPYRPCEGPAPGRRSGVPCLDYHIGRCAAPCVGLITREAYRAVIDDVIAFLEGRTNKIERDLERRMLRASEQHQFEEAARTRNRLTAVRHLGERQAVAVGSGTYDAIALAVEGDIANVQLLAVRGGRIEERRSHYLENAEVESEDTLLARFLLEYYDTQVGIPPLVCVHTEVADSDLIAGFLSERRGAAVELRVAERGDKRRVVAMALRNAQLGVRHDVLRSQRTRTRRIEGLEELREALNLEALPIRIECFDISNLQDTNAVASMVVFEDGAAKRSDYRRFGIRHGGGQDDFRSLAEAVTRRFERHRRVDEDGYDRSFATLPNLLVIDGGKGQLGAALDAMRAFDLPRVAVVSLAKREEEVYLPGRGNPVLLPRESPGLQLLQQVRDEAHRFALRGHRTRRAAGQTASLLDTLPGVGAVRRRALIAHFGDVARLLDASRAELEAVPGVPPAVGRAIYDHLHRVGGDGPSAG